MANADLTNLKTHWHASERPQLSPRPSLSTMTRTARRPTRGRAQSVATSVSLLCLAIIALFCLCPLAAKADEDPRSDYGTVIGIGQT